MPAGGSCCYCQLVGAAATASWWELLLLPASGSCCYCQLVGAAATASWWELLILPAGGSCCYCQLMGAAVTAVRRPAPALDRANIFVEEVGDLHLQATHCPKHPASALARPCGVCCGRVQRPFCRHAGSDARTTGCWLQVLASR